MIRFFRMQVSARSIHIHAPPSVGTKSVPRDRRAVVRRAGVGLLLLGWLGRSSCKRGRQQQQRTILSVALASTDEGLARNALQIGAVAVLGLLHLRGQVGVLWRPGNRLPTALFGAYLDGPSPTFFWLTIWVFQHAAMCSWSWLS